MQITNTMIFRNHRKNRCDLLLFSLKIFFFFFVQKPKICIGLKPYYEPVREVAKTDSFHSDKSNRYDLESDIKFKEDITENNNSCRFYDNSKTLLCKGSINYAFLKKIQNEEINYFVVENYEAESSFKKKYWSKKNLATGEWYLMIPKMYQKLSGQIYLEDSGLEMNVNMRLLPLKDLKGFYLEGEAFSNKLIKIAWTLTGKLHLDFINNRTVISLEVGAGGDSHWKLRSNLTFLRRNPEKESDAWKVTGFITAEDAMENQLVFYTGTVCTKLMKEECKFMGEVQLQNVNLGVTLAGKVTPPQQRQITIPRSAFSNMTIKNIMFKNSNFYNDFDKNSFEGVRGLKSITFVDSKLEMLPRLDELFQSFTELEEIYIEDCIALRLKFGSSPSLKKVWKLSFKGSGPLNFDDSTFTWLKNSNLTSLNLRNSNIKLSLKGNSLLWSVSNTLRNLDISYSTVNGEKEFTLVLNELNIITLKAESLKLKRIPTTGLNSVRRTLEFLSLRRNDFRKNLDRQIFDSVFNFPTMPNLKELNLEECHINFIERGAFDNLPNLKILHLSFNSLENIQDGWINIKPQITSLNLRHNGFFPKILPRGLNEIGISTNLNKFQQLQVLDLSDGIFMNINKVISDLGSSIRNLSLRNTRLENIPENVFENLTGLENLDLSYNRNIKSGPSFSFKLLRNLKNLTTLNLKQCRISGTSLYQGDFFDSDNSDNFILENLRSLDLSVNNFKILDSKMLRAFPNLKILNLAGNSITEWKTPILNNKNLETVFLEENKIDIITPDMLSNIKLLKKVKLGNNPFICGSYVYEILKIVSETEKTQTSFERLDYNISEKTIWEFTANRVARTKNLQNNINSRMKNDNVRILDWSETNYVCFSWMQGKFIPFSQVHENFHELTPEKEKNNEATLLWLGAIVVIGVVVTIVITCWKFLDIHLITRAVRNAVALTFIGRDEKDPVDFRYNVFVSYCDKDRSWVVENLLPRLESKSEVKVCLHERDFQVGLSIIENILNSIDNSRNIILVLSQAFLKSQWCQYEMQLAQFRLLEKGRDQLLLIFLENIPVVRRPKALKYLMMTKTYLQWPINPKNNHEIDTFWNRLMNSIIIKDY